MRPCLWLGAASVVLLSGCAEQPPFAWPWDQPLAKATPAPQAAPKPDNVPDVVAGDGAVSVGPEVTAPDGESAKAAAAAGVAAAPPPPNPKPATAELQAKSQLAKAPTDHDPRVLIGLDFDQASRLLGDPALREDKPPAKLWLFTGSSCSMRVFFYPTLGDTTYRVLTYEVDGDAAPKPAVNTDPETSAFARRCFGELMAQRDTKTGQ